MRHTATGRRTNPLFSVATVAVVLCAGAPCRADLRVIKHGDHVFARSTFSATQDLAVRVGIGSGNGQVNFSNTRLIDASVGMTEEELTGGTLIHGNGDDACPWNMNGTYIGANHGCSDGRELTCAGHGFTTADLGSEWEDESGRKYYMVKVVDPDRIWVLSQDIGTGARWDFDNSISGTLLTNLAQSTSFTFTNNAMAQIIPACRIASQSYLADGTTPLSDGVEVSCGYLDIVEEYDIINPASLLADIISHPGEFRSFTAAHLDGVVRNEIVYRLHANGATVIYYTATALQEFRLGYMGFIQSSKLATGTYDTHEYYVPRTVPFTQDAIDYDFKMLQDFTFTLPSALNFTDDKIEDTSHRPDRYIQLLGEVTGEDTNRQLGYAIGYSPIHGITQPEQRATNVNNALYLYTSSKSYPHAIDTALATIVPQNTEFYCIAYRHYFNPTDQTNATCVYWQQQEDDFVVYVDYHKSVDHDVIQLPTEWSGRAIAAISKTASVTLHAQELDLSGRLALSVAGGYGSAVFTVAPMPVAASGLAAGSQLELRVLPTPFTDATWVSFFLPRPGAATDIAVFGVDGRRVRTLLSGPARNGWNHVEWTGRADDGTRAAPGVYFVRAQVGAEAATFKVVRLADR